MKQRHEQIFTYDGCGIASARFAAPACFASSVRPLIFSRNFLAQTLVLGLLLISILL